MASAARVATAADLFSAITMIAEQIREETGYKPDTAPIPEGTRFVDWCEQLGRDGLKVDGRPFSLEGRKALRFLYEMIPSTREEARKKMLVVMKGAQVGATVWEMLASLYMLLAWGRCWVGAFVPDRTLATTKSDKRFLPILRSIPAAYERLGVDSDGKKRPGDGNVLTRSIDGNLIFFLWTSGKVSTESNPFDVLTFDEVQGMLIADIETTLERLSASDVGFVLLLSTAMWPDADIDYFFQRGSRYRFHHRCGCPDGVVLTDHVHHDHIECVAWHDESKDYQYRCPVCRTFILDNQDGEYRAEIPSAPFDSVHLPQTLSATVTAREFLQSFERATDKQNWFNRKAGLAYQDPSTVPINDAVINACVDEGRRLGVQWKKRAAGAYMGIDQMGAYNVVILRERLPDGRSATIHVEEVYDADPFARCDQLMADFAVHVCVVEQLPNYNDALRFAQRHPGKVFLANYGDLGDDMMRWGDEPRETASDLRVAEDAKSRHTVTLDQYKVMQVAMRRMQNRALVFPDPDGLVAETRTSQGREMKPILRDVVFAHFKKTALVVEEDEETRKKRRKVVKIGIDPHFSYANMLCEVAWSRAHGTSTFWTPPEIDPVAAATAQIAPAHQHPGTRCGGCVGMDPDTAQCTRRGFRVSADSPSCHIYVPRS